MPLQIVVFILCFQATDASSLGGCAIGLMTAGRTTRVVRAIVIAAHSNSASIVCADEYLPQSCETRPYFPSIYVDNGLISIYKL